LEQTQYGRGQLPPDGNIFQATQHTVAAGETLTAIARKHYNDGNKWKLIANVNKIDNGDVLREGQELIIPPLPEEGRFHTEAYDHITDNPFLAAVDNPLSTFS